MCKRYKPLVWLTASLLIVAATFRPGPINLGIVVDTVGSSDAREAQQMAVESLLAAARPGDSVALVTRGQPLFRALRVHPGVQAQFVQASGLDLAAAVAEAAHCLADQSSLLVVLANDASPSLGSQAFQGLPPGSRIRLVGAAVRPALIEFNHEGLWKHDLRVAPASGLASATYDLVREIRHLRVHRPTPFTWTVLASSLLTALLLSARRRWLSRRQIEILLSTTEDDLQLVPLQDGERFEVASGAILQREGGRVRLIRAIPEEPGRSERWLVPGDGVELATGDESWPIRVDVLRT